MKSYKYLPLIIIYFILSQLIFSQVNNSITVFDTTLTFTLSKNIEPYVVHFEIIDSVDITIYKTKIYDSNKVFIQSINDTINFMGKEHRMMVDQYSDEPQNPNFNDDISFVDINFDGYTDIKIKSLVTVHGSSAFNYFLYNLNSYKFIYNQDFSDLDGNISINAKLKEIYFTVYYWQEDAHYRDVYNVIDNKPVLFTSESKRVLLEDIEKGKNQRRYNLLIEKLIEGEMRTVVDTIVIE